MYMLLMLTWSLILETKIVGGILARYHDLALHPHFLNTSGLEFLIGIQPRLHAHLVLVRCGNTAQGESAIF
jgi:hypothetical protein